ncbi:MAG: DNA topoisomerase IV subunit A [Parcubacteria group bacterium Gr01-1014_19]|nr:MAG: DNA topoisomerase IV subunit A [Parcubacteria group bacterium Gr01-1014_19]
MGNLTKKFASVAVSAATVAWLSGFSMLVPVAHAQTSLQGQIDALLAQIAALQAQLAAGSSSSVAACSFTRDLTLGVKGDDVMCLQKYLNSTGQKVSTSGPGSPGSETSYFGSLTASAVAKWQAANGVAPAAGYFGKISRAKYSALAAAAPAPAPAPVPGTPAPVPSGSGLTVSLAADQPAAGLFGESFSSRPFTKLTLRASADGDVTVKALVIERQGQGADAAFSGVIGLDEDGIRMGVSKTLGSDHRLRLTETFTVKAGQTRTVTISGDSDADQNDYNGQLVSLALVGVEVAGSTAVNASFPLVGNNMTVNSTLSIGSVTLARGALDPGSGQTKEIGSTGYRFSGLRVTAGANEDVLVRSVKWNQSGSAGTGDLANVKVVFDGVTYATTLSEDNKYYVAKFGDGIKILKGLNKEMHVQGDVINGSARTADFDLYRYADLRATGLTYGYDILPTATEVAASADDGNFHAAEPNFDAFQAHIGSGSIDAQNAPSVGAQNIAINLANQPLGGFIVDVKGEDITVAAINFDMATAGDATAIDSNDVTNITLVDEDGKVVAGPVDGVAGGNNAIRFSDTITFKVGRKVYSLKGKLGTDFISNDTVAASTTPSSDWTTVKGVTSGVTVTPTPSSAVTGSTMTVKASSLTLTVSPETNAGGSDASSTAQNVVAGTADYVFTKYVLDASGSGEDLKITSMSPRLGLSAVNTGDDVTNCQLLDGSVALNTGTNIVNPTNSAANADNVAFVFDVPLVLAKGTIKTLSLKCNLISGADAGQQWRWGIADAAGNMVSTGSVSGQSVTETITADNGRIITGVGGGTLTIALDSASPAVKLVASGATDQTLAVFRLNATNEDIRLDTIGLQLATSTTNAADGTVGNASNSPSDLSKVTLWNGSTKVGEATFSSTDYATGTLSGVTVPKNGQILLTVKGDMANIGTNLTARPGHLVIINYDAQSSSDETNLGAVGVGLSSGTTIAAAGADSGSSGARLVRTVPTVEKQALPSGSKLANGSRDLFRFKVTAPSGGNGVGLYKFTFDVSTSSVSTFDNDQDADKLSAFRVNDFIVKCYSDAAFSVASCGSADGSGQLNNGDFATSSVHEDLGGDRSGLDIAAATVPTMVEVYFNPANTADTTQDNHADPSEAIRVPAGESRYFVLSATVVGSGTSSPQVSTKLLGDGQWLKVRYTPNDLSTTGDSDDGTTNEDVTIAGDNWTTGRYVFATTAALADTGDDDNFIWSAHSTNTSQSNVDYDWLNGFLIPGLPTGGTTAETLTL